MVVLNVSNGVTASGSGADLATAVGNIDNIGGEGIAITANVTGDDYTGANLNTINTALGDNDNITLADATAALAGSPEIWQVPLLLQ